MKTMFLLLMFLLLINVFVCADVNVEIVDIGDNKAEIYYYSTDPNNIPRAFTLDIVAEGAVIENYCVDNAEPYWVYFGSIDVDTDNNTILNFGSPVVEGSNTGSLGGLGKSGITIEMGSLYNIQQNGYDAKPNPSGLLITLELSDSAFLTVSRNKQRSETGIVLEDVSYAVVDYSLATEIEISGVSIICETCIGDLNGNGRVTFDDFLMMMALMDSVGWNDIFSDSELYNPCADWSQNGRVTFDDFLQMMAFLENNNYNDYICP